MLLLIILSSLGLQILQCATFVKIILGTVSRVLSTTTTWAQYRGDRVIFVTDSEKKSQRSPRAVARVSLYCFMVCRPEEESLLRAHLELGTLHNCDAFDVFSNTTNFPHSLPDGLSMVAAVDGSMDVKKGGPYHTSLNSKIFQQVWRAVFLLGRYRSFDWVVKVDPDTLFFPDSVRLRLEGLRPQVQGHHHKIILLNAGGHVHGPLIVVSQAAAGAYAADPARCETEVDITEKSEDWYFHSCMNILRVAARPCPWLLKEWWMHETRNTLEHHCTDPRLPSALHPLKSPALLRECLVLRQGTLDMQLMDFSPIPGPILSRDGKHIDSWSYPSSTSMVKDNAPLARLRRREILISMMLRTTKHGERFYDSALSCFLGQTYPRTELVVLSSAKSSTDDRGPIAFWENAARRHPNIKYAHRVTTTNDESKERDARDDILERSEGEIIAVLDDDDYYHPEYVTRMAEQLLLHEAQVVGLSRFDVLFAPSPERDGVRKAVFLEANFNGCGNTGGMFGHGFPYIFKRSQGVKYAPRNFQEDISFAKQNAKVGGRVLTLHQPPLPGIVVKVLRERQLSTVFCLNDSSMNNSAQKIIASDIGINVILSANVTDNGTCEYRANVDTVEKRNLDLIELQRGTKHLCCALCAAFDRCGGFTFFYFSNYRQGCALKLPIDIKITEQPSFNVILGITPIKTEPRHSAKGKHVDHDSF